MAINNKYANIYLVAGILILFITFSLVTLYFMEKKIYSRSSVHIKNEKMKKSKK